MENKKPHVNVGIIGGGESPRHLLTSALLAGTGALARLRDAAYQAGKSAEALADAILAVGKAQGLSAEQIASRFQKPDDLIIESPPPEPMLQMLPFMAMSAGLGYDIPQVFLSSGRHHTTSRRPAIPGKRARSQRERSRRRKGARRAKTRS